MKNFEHFWAIYPNKKNSQAALTAWERRGFEDKELSMEVISVVRGMKENNEEFPMAHNFLMNYKLVAQARPKANNGYICDSEHAYRPTKGKIYPHFINGPWSALDEQEKWKIISVWENRGKTGLLNILNQPEYSDNVKYKTFKFLGALERDGYLEGRGPNSCDVDGCRRMGTIARTINGEGTWLCRDHFWGSATTDDTLTRRPWVEAEIDKFRQSHKDIKTKQDFKKFSKSSLDGNVFKELPYDKTKSLIDF
jgi:hypothetical protein